MIRSPGIRIKGNRCDINLPVTNLLLRVKGQRCFRCSLGAIRQRLVSGGWRAISVKRRAKTTPCISRSKGEKGGGVDARRLRAG